MVANVHAPEETQSLLDASVPDGGRSTKTRGVSFARVAVGGTLLAGLAVAAVASGGGATSVAAAGASVFRLGAADASPANAASLKPKPKPTAAQIAWWKAHHPDGGAETAAAGAKKPSKDVTEKASASTASANRSQALGRCLFDFIPTADTGRRGARDRVRGEHDRRGQCHHCLIYLRLDDGRGRWRPPLASLLHAMAAIGTLSREGAAVITPCLRATRAHKPGVRPRVKPRPTALAAHPA